MGTRADEPFVPVEEEAKIQSAIENADEPETEASKSPDEADAVEAKDVAEATPKSDEDAPKAKKTAKKTAKKAAKKVEAKEEGDEVEAKEEDDKSKTTRLRKGGRAKAQAETPPRPEA